ncbi:MAG: translation elongation factor EF-1beta [Methanomassiliicoccaceae archaeon]|jgi:elongation factor 1-beta|nr:translation elongation factor EF-1beta [Methanomassiliicoccaceae archaeon]
MGRIVAQYDLMPESTDISLESVVDALGGIIPKGVTIIETKIQPVAFGLKKVVAGFVIDDSDDSIGGKLEDALRSIPGVENVECISTALL